MNNYTGLQKRNNSKKIIIKSQKNALIVFKRNLAKGIVKSVT